MDINSCTKENEAEVSWSEESAKSFFNNIIPMKLEPDNETQQNLHPLLADELEAPVKTEDCSEDLDIKAKSELDELDQIGAADAVYRLNDNVPFAVVLEKIPKTETKIVGGFDDTSLFGHEICYSHIQDTESDADSEDDPEFDPFADVDCNPRFSQPPQSNNNSNLSPSAKVALQSTRSYSKQLRRRVVDSNFQCKLCLENHKTKSTLQTHIETCAASHKNRHRFCIRCNKLFSVPHSYRCHALNSHGVQEAKINKCSFKCQFCPRFFGLNETLVAHSAVHHASSSSVTSDMSDSNFNASPYKCLQCTSTFEKLTYLTSHMKSHTQGKERPVKCPIKNCEKAFNFNSGLQEHMRRVHSKKRPFKCQKSNCNKTFKTKDQLRKHQVCHLQDRPYKCSYSAECAKTFKSKDGLAKHLSSHAGTRRYKHITESERPFKCGECDRAFCKNWQLTVHRGRVHMKDEKDMLECPEPNCDWKFKYKHNLASHIFRIHTNKDSLPFQCPEPNCGKKFKYKSSAEDHGSSHRGERPFKCSQTGCTASFARNGYLNRHMRERHRAKNSKKTIK